MGKNAIQRFNEIADWSAKRFKELKRKKYDWQSFHNGIVEYWSYLERQKINKREERKRLSANGT